MDLSPFDSLFSKNVPHILEKIFLSLDYESYKKCLQVSKDWKEQLTSELFQRKGKSVFNEELFLDEGKLIKASRDGIQDEVKRLLSSVMLDVNCKYGPRSCKDGPRGPGSTSLRWPEADFLKTYWDISAKPPKLPNVPKLKTSLK